MEIQEIWANKCNTLLNAGNIPETFLVVSSSVGT